MPERSTTADLLELNCRATGSEEAIEVEQRVLVFNHSFGRVEGSTQEVEEAPAGIWTVRDGKIARAEFYADRAEARQVVGRVG